MEDTADYWLLDFRSPFPAFPAPRSPFPVLVTSRCEQHLRRLPQKKCQNHDRKQQQFTLTWRIWRTRQCRAFIFGHHTSSETQRQIKGARESLNGRKNIYGTKKSKERREEPLGTMSYQTSSKRSLPFWLLIGARKTLSAPGSPRMATIQNNNKYTTSNLNVF